MGETVADYLNVSRGLGLSGTTYVMGALLLAALDVQISAKRYVPVVYWIAVVLLSVVGTLITDNLVDNLQVPVETTTLAFSIALAATFVAWYLSERTLAITAIDSTRRELFYWATILSDLPPLAMPFIKRKSELQGYWIYRCLVVEVRPLRSADVAQRSALVGSGQCWL